LQAAIAVTREKSHFAFVSREQSLLRFFSGSFHESDCLLARTNYQYEKRRRELAKKKKKEEKRQKKMLKNTDPDAASETSTEDSAVDGDNADRDDTSEDDT